MFDIAIAILDASILAWLVGTWFYEGHHRRCEVVAICPTCGGSSMQRCGADRRKP